MAWICFSRALRRVSRSFLDVLAPRSCGACERVGVQGAFCLDCIAQAPPLAPVAEPTRVGNVPVLALGPFVSPLSLAIKQLKYSGRTDLAEPLAELWWQRWGPRVARNMRSSPDLLLVPVPLHAERLVERGYNQSGLWASQLARLARARVGHALIERVHATGQQARLTARERGSNLSGAFRASSQSDIRSDTRIVLVDDVVTTGATLVACQAACRAASLTLSEVWALAHTERADARPPA